MTPSTLTQARLLADALSMQVEFCGQVEKVAANDPRYAA